MKGTLKLIKLNYAPQKVQKKPSLSFAPNEDLKKNGGCFVKKKKPKKQSVEEKKCAPQLLSMELDGERAPANRGAIGEWL